MTIRIVPAAAAVAAYIATIPAANLAIAHFGAVPVGFGQVAPAGVYLAGLALVLRDVAREAAGRRVVLAAMAAGVVLSYVLADPIVAVASAVAFAVSEGADAAVYEPLRRRGRIRAMGISSAVGLLLDSLIFLWIAFGSLEFFAGQVLGKAAMTVAALAVIAGIRHTRRAEVTA